MERLLRILLLSLLTVLLACKQQTSPEHPVTSTSPLLAYVHKPDSVFEFKLAASYDLDGYQVDILRMTSQQWLGPGKVRDPLWWHWITVVVPDEVQSNTALLWIGGGSRNRELPDQASDLLVQTALMTKSVAAEIHNIPNQPVEFVQDTFGPRVEDELIAYGWRQFLEADADSAAVEWLARLPMTKSVVRAMDAISLHLQDSEKPVSQYTVGGASKRGWTTWTTAVADDRVVGIVPVVIDMLNLVPSFQHHWQVYGFWAPAVGNYVQEGIMEWQNHPAYRAMTRIVEPYEYRKQLTLPKLMINATGDQFFLPDSWQFYWDSLPGEKLIRYVPNADHSLRNTDALSSLIAFHNTIVNETDRPALDWNVNGDSLIMYTQAQWMPDSILLWKAHNPESRDFRLETIGSTWTSEHMPINKKGDYVVHMQAPDSGWNAYLLEVCYSGASGLPFKVTTGTAIYPDKVSFPPFKPKL